MAYPTHKTTDDVLGEGVSPLSRCDRGVAVAKHRGWYEAGASRGKFDDQLEVIEDHVGSFRVVKSSAARHRAHLLNEVGAIEMAIGHRPRPKVCREGGIDRVLEGAFELRVMVEQLFDVVRAVIIHSRLPIPKEPLIQHDQYKVPLEDQEKGSTILVASNPAHRAVVLQLSSQMRMPLLEKPGPLRENQWV